MKELDRGRDKIQKICNLIRQNTLEPAQQEAQDVMEKATREAEQILHQARLEAKRIADQTHEELEKERKAFFLSLHLTAKQALGSLREEVEKRFFDDSLKRVIASASSDPQLIARLVNALVKAVEDQGMDANLRALIPSHLPLEAVNALLTQEVVSRLKGGGVEVGNFSGGAQLKLENKQMTLDISDKALFELLASHLRKEFRKYLYG